MKEHVVEIDLKDLGIKRNLSKLMQIRADLSVLTPNLLWDGDGSEVSQLQNGGEIATDGVISLLLAIHGAVCDMLGNLIGGVVSDDSATDEVSAKIKELKASAEIIARKISTKERDAAKDSDYVIPENRSFPILKSADVPAAVHSFGRSKSGISFEKFKARLIKIATRKGFQDALPKEWKDEKKD